MEPPLPPDGGREARLDRLREELRRASASSRPLDLDELRRRYADLEPELTAILRVRDETLDAGAADLSTQVGLGETLASGPTELAPSATLANAPSQVDLGETVAQTGWGESLPGSLGDAAGDTWGETQPDGGGIAAPPRRPTTSPAEPRPPGERIRYVGDYELGEVLGRGGIGVVYRARQLSVNRMVAVKMIRNAEFAGGDQLRRFQNEAEAVALLDHPGIVPIYEVGTHDDERYFSMKLIEGPNLEAKLPGLATDLRAVATLIARVADAVDHAHRRGILHRDLKPANILVDAHGAPHVTDFGLARKIEGDAGLTVSGAIMGTPAYMSPEQALGRTREVTTATDVYGLGGVLYAALTGDAPFRGDSVLETLEHVRYTPPETPRKRNADVPPDLEVVCLKCLEKDPKRRYATAGELADDLRRWLDGEPIRARPVSAAVRLWMWCKRKPALAATSAALAAALVIGVVGITWQWRTAVALRVVAERARVRAETSETAAVVSEKAAQAARVLAEQNAALAGRQATYALSTVQNVITQVQKNLNTPGTADFKKGLLDSALANVKQVADAYDRSTSREATTLAALSELGKIYRQLGQSEKSFRYFERCQEIAKERVKIKEGSDASRMNLANNYLELAISVEEYKRDMKASLAYNRESLKIWQDIFDHPKPAGFPLAPAQTGFWLAEAHQRVGIGLYRLGEIAPAFEEYRKAHAIRLSLVDKFPKEPQFRQDLTYSLLALAETSFRLGDRKKADEYYAEVIERRAAFRRENPKNPVATGDLAAAEYMIGEFKLKTGDLASARDHLNASRDLRKSLVDADRENAIYRRDLALSLYRLGNLGEIAKKGEEAGEAFKESLKLREDLVKGSEANEKRRMELMLALAHNGKIREATEIADAFVAGTSVDREMRVDLARCYAQCARASEAEQPIRVQEFLRKAVDMLKAAVADGYRDRVAMETEPDLAPLRDRDLFRRLLPP